MRNPARTKGLRAQVSRTKSIPAPVGGWNKRDSVAEMPATDAVIMDNLFPTASDVMMRKGQVQWATGITGTVETLLDYDSATASKLFAAASASIYDVTATGAVGAAVQTGLTNARWQHVNFATTGGQFLVAVNGADKLREYDGTTWNVIDGASTPAITGVATTDLIHVNVFKRRLWFVQKDSMKVWYLPVDSIGGAAQSIDFGSLFEDGGYLVAMGTWSIDAGEGVDDHAAFVTSQGQVAIYKGTDPSSVTTWALVGVFRVGSPVSRRCLVKFGGDLLMIGRDGLLPFSKALMSSRVNTKSALTDKIQQQVSQATTDFASLFGWEVLPYPTENMLIINVPTSAETSDQYVMNTITGSWCRFLEQPAACWALWGEEIYYGTAGGVVKAWHGTSDFGNNIVADVLPAFSDFGAPALLKQFSMMRPVFVSDGIPGVQIDLNIDYDLTVPVGAVSLTSSSSGLWDSGVWDASRWGTSGLNVVKDWITVSGVGYVASPYLRLTSKSLTVHWAASDFVFQPGGVIG